MNMPASCVARGAGLPHGGHCGHVRLGPNANHLAGMLASYEHNVRTAIRWVHSSWLMRALGLGEAAALALRERLQHGPCEDVSLALMRALQFAPPSLERLIGVPAARLDALPIEQGRAALCIRALLLRRAQVRRLIDRNTRVRLAQWAGLPLDRIADPFAAPDLTRVLGAAAVPSLESLEHAQLALEGYALLAREPQAGNVPCALLRLALPYDARHAAWLDAVPAALDESGTGVLHARLAELFPEYPWLSG
ncbi:type III secretion protein SctK (plasmid) [Burkholderia sp. M6-3]